MKFSQKMPLNFFYTTVQKSQKWPKTQIRRGGPALRQAWTDQKRDFWRRYISHFLHLGDMSFQVSALFFDWKWKKRERKERSLWSTRRRRPRLLYLTRNRHTCQTTRESRVAVAHVVTLNVVVRSWVIDKQAKTMQPVQVVVGEASPGLGLPVLVVALSLMSANLQRNISCSSSASRAYASFPTTRTETQTAGVVVRLKKQHAQSNLFPIMVRLDPKNLKTLSIRVDHEPML